MKSEVLADTFFLCSNCQEEILRCDRCGNNFEPKETVECDESDSWEHKHYCECCAEEKVR